MRLGVVTLTLPVVAPLGTVVVISVLETTVKVAGVPLKATLALIRKNFVRRGTKVEQKGPPMRNLECVARAVLSGREGPKDEVDGRAVAAGDQAGLAD